MKLHFRVALLALLLGFLASTGLRAADLPPYEINTVLALTGAVAFSGQAMAKSLVSLEKIINAHYGINGRPVHFVVYDDQSSPQLAVQLVSQIMAKKVPVILGPDFSSTCRSVLSMVVNGPVLYCLSPGVLPVKGGYVFAAGASTAAALLRDFQFLRSRGWTRVATLTTIDSTGQDADNSIGEALAAPENRNISIVAREHFNNTDISVAAQIARIQAGRPQALIAWTTGPAIGTVFQALKTAAFNIPVVTTTGNQSYSFMKQYQAFLPTELYVATCIYVTGTIGNGNAPELRAFYEADAAMGIKPDQLSADPWDPALILIDALRHTGSDPTAAKVHDYIESLHGFRGLVGTYDFRDGSNRGVGLADVLETQWDVEKDKWVVAK